MFLLSPNYQMRYRVSVWEEGRNEQLWQAGDLWRGCTRVQREEQACIRGTVE